MWSLGKRAERFGRTPSEVLGIRAALTAYWFDEAVDWFCRWVEGMLAQGDEKGKPMYTLEKLLGVQQYAKIKRAG